MPRIRLIIRGDDAGCCVSANRAIEEGYASGVLLNTSVIVPGPAFEDAVERFASRPNLCIGLHATLTSEWGTPKWGPVLPRERVPSLVRADGSFFWHQDELNRNNPDPDEMIAEIKAQLDRARNRGLKITYVDEHMDILWLRGLKERFDRLAAEEGLIQAETIRYLPVKWADHRTPLEALSVGLKAAAPGTYAFFTHPGMDTSEMRAMVHPGIEPGRVARERDADRKMLAGPEIKEMFRELDVETITYEQAGKEA